MKTYDMNIFYNEELTTPGKDNELYQQMLKEFDEKYPELSQMGIYAIRYEGNLCYVGKATHIAKRWLAHTFNATHSISKEYHRAMYIVLRHMFALGQVTFEVLETADDKDKLDWLEGYWINRYMPCLNKKVPKLGEYEKNIYLGEVHGVMPDILLEDYQELRAELIAYKK